MYDVEKELLNDIVSALNREDYEPYNQIRGFLKVVNTRYITRTNGARYKIASIDKSVIEQYLKENK